MIVDDTTRLPRRMALAPLTYSRRAFLGLAACGLLAACAAPHATSTGHVAIHTPSPLVPSAPITAENAGHLTQLAEFSPRDGYLRGLAWSPDGRVLAAGSYVIHLWEIATGAQVGVWKGHSDQVYALSWSAASGLLASASADSTVRIWDASSGTTAHVLSMPSKAPAFSVDWSPDGTKLVAGTLAGTVELWDAQTGQHLATWAGPPLNKPVGKRNPFAVWGVAWSPDGRTVTSTRYDMHVLVWDAVSGGLRASLTPDSQPNGTVWKPDGSMFASSDDNGTVQLWDASAGNANPRTLTPRENAGWSYPMVWTPDGALLACATEEGQIQLWDMRTGTELAPLQAHQSAVWGLALSRDALRLATASDDGTARVWGVR